MREFDLFHGYPEPAEPRIVGPHIRTIENRIQASYREKEFFDGDRKNGYGGLKNDGRWKKIAENIVSDYSLGYGKILQINAQKGFLAYELYKMGCRLYTTETSDYACKNSIVRHTRCEPWDLPYENNFFDFVICQSAVYSENLKNAIRILKEIQRVSGGRAWVSLGAYEDENDIEGLMLLRYWFILGTTILTKSDWLKVMEHAGYTGDYRFDTAKFLNLRRG